MDATAYCDTLEEHLTKWKAKLYEAIRIVDRLPEAEKETAFPSIRGLYSIVDQIDAEVENIVSLEPLVDKWRSFGWEVFEMNGHDWDEIYETLNRAIAVKAKPAKRVPNTADLAIIASFVMSSRVYRRFPPSPRCGSTTL